VSETIIRDLSWISNHIKSSSGVFFFKAIVWRPDEADSIIYCDASFDGIGFWSPTHSDAHYGDVPLNPPKGVIFFFEAFAVLCALQWAVSLEHCPKRLVIYSDNENTVEMFNNLRALAGYNDILTDAVDILIKHEIDLRVHHIAGLQNVVADRLSRRLFDYIRREFPHLNIKFYTPPSRERRATAE